MDTEFKAFQACLLRAPVPDSRKCSFGKFPRHGRPARRFEDCTINCQDYAACEAANLKGETLEPK